MTKLSGIKARSALKIVYTSAERKKIIELNLKGTPVDNYYLDPLLSALVLVAPDSKALLMCFVSCLAKLTEILLHKIFNNTFERVKIVL